MRTLYEMKDLGHVLLLSWTWRSPFHDVLDLYGSGVSNPLKQGYAQVGYWQLRAN